MKDNRDDRGSSLPAEDDNFRFLSELGQGSYGKVYKAIEKSNQRFAAVKVYTNFKY